MSSLPHYYGDTVRALFFIGGIIMLIALPLKLLLINAPAIVVIFVMLLLDMAAGLTNPESKWTIIFDTIVSGVAFIIFEYYTVIEYSASFDSIFWTNQALAIIFFLAFYYCVKTWRGSAWFLN